MRIPLPTRIPVAKAFVFCAVLAVVELLEGTLPVYTLMVFLFFMLSIFAFNAAGGFSRPSGGYIFFYSVLTVGFGTIFKALLGQAAHTHIAAPVLTISVYAASALALLVAAFLARKIATTADGAAGLLQVPRLDMRISALGCYAVVFLINFGTRYLPAGNGSVLHAVEMVNYFLPLGILLGTIATVRGSGGRHSVSLLTAAAMFYAFWNGMLVFSKQAMLTPFVCWLLGVAWARFRLRPRHLIAMALFAYATQNFITPLANVGRVDVPQNASLEKREAMVLGYLEHPARLKRIDSERVNSYADFEYWYFGKPSGILDRLTMLSVDSQLIGFTAQGHYFGYLPVVVYFQNWVPHILAPHKLEGVYVGGNRYAHEMGQLADDDWTTGISYSPSAEAFHLDGWRAVLLLQPCIFLLVFVTADAVCGDLRRQPWGLLAMLLFAHIAPEELLMGSINYVWMGNVGTVFAIFVCGYITPIFGGLLKGRERAPVWSANVSGMRPEIATATAGS